MDSRSTKYECIRGLVSVLVLGSNSGSNVHHSHNHGGVSSEPWFTAQNKKSMLIIHMRLSYHDFIITSIRTNINRTEKYNITASSQSVASIHPEISTSDILGRITEQEGDGPHEVFRVSHLSGGDQRGPLLFQFRVFVQDLARSIWH